jgi:hypothetical protein
MNLISIYSSLQSLPKDVMGIVWQILRPDGQRKLGMTCVKFKDMFYNDKNIQIPDLDSRLAKGITKKSPNHTKEEYDEKISRWKIWVNESIQIDDRIFRWRWIRNSGELLNICRNYVSLEILFMKIEQGYLILKIRAQYQTPRYKNYSFSEFDIHSVHKSSRYMSNNNIHGPKFKNLPKDSIIYQQLSLTIKTWISNDKNRYLLNPVCHDTLYERNIRSLTFRIKDNIFFGLKCNKCDSGV